MEHVGDACASHGNIGTTGSEITLLGFASWGVINGKKTLTNPVSLSFCFSALQINITFM